MSKFDSHYPYESPIDAYGNGGFRFAGMSHIGSVICTPNGIYAWSPSRRDALAPEDFELVFARLEPPITLLLGTGERQVWPSPQLTSAFAAKNIGLEPMSTGAAARTYNILIAEKRRIAAALIAIP